MVYITDKETNDVMVEETKEQIEKQIKEQAIVEVDEPINDRSEVTIDKFMDDMSMLGTQVRNPTLKKPTFHYGDLAVTNYLLWLILAEMMQLNDKLEGEAE